MNIEDRITQRLPAIGKARTGATLNWLLLQVHIATGILFLLLLSCGYLLLSDDTFIIGIVGIALLLVTYSHIYARLFHIWQSGKAVRHTPVVTIQDYESLLEKDTYAVLATIKEVHA